ncbi:MAG: hypothetical protein IPI67_05725 [Myxococcales bacterium]|nr:hypothetical protein [Myxococcales bacterium]
MSWGKKAAPALAVASVHAGASDCALGDEVDDERSGGEVSMDAGGGDDRGDDEPVVISCAGCTAAGCVESDGGRRGGNLRIREGTSGLGARWATRVCTSRLVLPQIRSSNSA